jgi:hypothetical protein
MQEICVLIIRKDFICRPPTVHGFKMLCNICLLAHLQAGRQKCKMYIINDSTKKELIPRAIMQPQAGTELQLPQLCSQKKTVSEVKMQRA